MAFGGGRRFCSLLFCSLMSTIVRVFPSYLLSVLMSGECLASGVCTCVSRLLSRNWGSPALLLTQGKERAAEPGFHATACFCASKCRILVPCTRNRSRRPSGKRGCSWVTFAHSTSRSRVEGTVIDSGGWGQAWMTGSEPGALENAGSLGLFQWYRW